MCWRKDEVYWVPLQRRSGEGHAEASGEALARWADVQRVMAGDAKKLCFDAAASLALLRRCGVAVAAPLVDPSLAAALLHVRCSG